MNVILIIKIFLILTFNSFLFCQSNSTSIDRYFSEMNRILKDSKVEIENINTQYKKDLSEYDLRVVALEQYFSKLSKKEVLEIISKKQKAEKEDLFKLEKRKLLHAENINNANKSEITNGIFENILHNRLKELFAPGIAQIIFSPITIKITVDDIRSDIYNYKNELKIKYNIVRGEINEIIKGNGFIKNQDIFEFYYYDQWLTGSNRFQKNRTYIVSIYPILDNIYETHHFALATNKFNDGIIEINNSITDNGYFNLGNVTWKEFKDRIKYFLNLDYEGEKNEN